MRSLPMLHAVAAGLGLLCPHTATAFITQPHRLDCSSYSSCHAAVNRHVWGASRVSLSESLYHESAMEQAPDDESHHHQQQQQQQQPPIPSGARLAYLVVVHNRRTIEDALNLFRAIRSPNTVIMIHVDTKLDWNIYLQSKLYREIEYHSQGAKVVVASVHSAEWSSWSMNDPTHWGMELATSRFRGQWDVFLNLSGDCMPVYSSQVMSQMFDPRDGPLRQANFVTSSSCDTGLLPTSSLDFPKEWHKRNHYGQPTIEYVDDDGSPQQTSMVVHWGSQWMALLPEFVDYLVQSLKRPDSLASRYRDELIKTERLMTDETFIPTILMEVHPFNQTLPVVNEDGTLKAMPSLRSIRYERMDEHMPTAFGGYPTEQRYEVPDSSLADQPHVWGPYFLGVYDLANIKDSGALFVRKVSVFVDPNIVNLLPVKDIDDLPSIQWPSEVKIGQVPDWDKKVSDYMERQAEEQQ